MYLIEILLPIRDNEGKHFARATYKRMREELAELFGGVTAFMRSPAKGETKKGSETVRDDIVVFEVMAETIDRKWWRRYRETLEGLFDQDEIVVRAVEIEKL
jgi:hypothetical protein